ATVLTVARPGDDEAPRAVHRHAGVLLVSRGGRIDTELAALGNAGRVIALSVDAPAAAVLAVARPGDHVVAVAVHRDPRALLVAGGGGVNAGLAPLGDAGRVVALGVDAPAAAILTVT